MFVILRKELAVFFSSLSAYVTIGFFLIITGLLVWVAPNVNVLKLGYADLTAFFQLAPYLFMFLAPAITMSLWAEERRSGTIELLLTSPIQPLAIIIGKYMASFLILFITLLLTSPYVISLYFLASPIGNIDLAAIFGAYIGLCCLAAVFLAIGLTISFFTENQIVAFLLSTLLCFCLYQGLAMLADLLHWRGYALTLLQFGMSYHYQSLSRGVLDLKDMVYFFNLAYFFLTIHSFAIYKR